MVRSAVRFLLDGQIREIADQPPTMTVLQYLRESERRIGSKEGCAEGDCGACTVVLCDLAGERIRYRAVNSCILLLPMLDGKELITVESLAGPREALHPVQQAMVASHASQCGFCTPGFVMSLFALWHQREPPDRDGVAVALAGNLCRCTGYRPILDAALSACAERVPDRFDRQAPARRAQLETIRPSDGLALDHGGQLYFAPATLDQLALLYCEHPNAVLLAGGTDVGVWVTKQHRHLPSIISLAAIEALHRIDLNAEAVEIGAAATYAEAFEALAELAPDLGEFLRRLGAVQVRNLGTLGGNLGNASPIGDMPPVLMALDAVLLLRRGDSHREVAVEDFFVGYRRTILQSGEFIERIRIARPPPGAAFRAYKIAKRFDQDISAVCGAFSVRLAGRRIADIRLAFGGVAATPLRARNCEQALSGRNWTRDAVAAALPALASDISPISDLRASADYRRLVAGNLLRKFQLELSAEAAPLRLPALTRC